MVAPGRPRDRFWDIYGWKRTFLSNSNEKPEGNLVECVMFHGVHVATNLHVCVVHKLAFSRLVARFKSNRYFHLIWRQFGMSNPAKRGHAPPSGDTPGKNPAKKTANAHHPRSRKTLFQSELKPPVSSYKVSTILARSNSYDIYRVHTPFPKQISRTFSKLRLIFSWEKSLKGIVIDNVKYPYYLNTI